VLLAILAIALTQDSGPRRFSLEPVAFDRLSGWMQDHISAAVPGLLKSCDRFLTRADSAPLDAVAMSANFGRVGEWRSLCEAAQALPSEDDAAAREFFETRFIPFAVADYGNAEGLFTGYYEIELNGSRQHQGRYQTPLYRSPQISAFSFRRAQRSRMERLPSAGSSFSGSMI
jgi:membrane-bound lytic murein transglycosylase A